MLNLEPKTLWQCFFEICQVPRPSKKEEQIISFLLDWSKTSRNRSRKRPRR